VNYSRPFKGKVIVFGILFWYPLAGVTYQFLHYLLGLRRLGYDTYYIEDSGRWIYNPRIHDLSPDATENIEQIAPILEAFGFKDRWAFRGHYPNGKCYGMNEAQIMQLYQEADAFLNVTGAQEIREEHMACRCRIYVESDPVASQIRVIQGDETLLTELSAHNIHFSFGENLGALDCKVPVERFQWLPTRQPIDLDLWHTAENTPENTYTTVTSWDNNGKDISYQGETYYWRKAREFEKFLALPHKRSLKFEIATADISEDARLLLQKHGWSYVDAVEISQDPNRYRQYIQRSRGEFTVAKDQYTRLCSGWFSDRSVCYLAAGRPVITQETGFSKFLPTGKGLFAFKTMEEILAALDAIESDYAGNCQAAREIATEYFAAEKTIGSLMERAGL